MTKILTFINRGKNVESIHEVKCLVINKKKQILLSTGDNSKIIFPRSSIKIFQAIPFIESGAVTKFKLNSKQISLACSSHSGEKFHIKELRRWFDKLPLTIQSLKCGIHNPINLNASNELLLSGIKPNQLYNNCSGKHLGMLTSCVVNNYNIKNYLNFNHPHQIKIRNILELFSENKISKKNFGVDGCSAPQYAFNLKNLSNALLNLIKSYKIKFYHSDEVRLMINSILNYPEMIGGTNRFDNHLIKSCNKKLFCKGGAEGVFLFAHLKKEIVGIVKVVDGNERALPSAVSTILKKLKITSNDENKKLSIWISSYIKNHAKNITGKIFTDIK
ncbi:MAG: hypothetical protein CMP16_00135 [Rickettsiales bacterium]|nr:hypothetical protein [Rickettsiales bacterium]|tara:strand:- start:910 stop:1905 length:996 start_codon:yes stop_codon:yes gene_type:complete